MLLGIPNETCAGLKKLSTCFGMRSRQKIANILCEWVTKKKKNFLAHQISSQYKVWMETAIRNTSNSFLQPLPTSSFTNKGKELVVGDGNKAKGTRTPPTASNTNKHIGESTKHGGLRTFRELIRTETDVLDRWFAIAEQFNQANRCRKARTFLHEEETNQSKMFQKN